jgi:hypothetical protein
VTNNAPPGSAALPSVYTDGFPLSVLSRTIIDGARRAAQSEADRFWSTPERYAADPTREVLDITFNGRRLINYLGFETAHFPHSVTAEYRDEHTAAWLPFLASDGSPAVYLVGDSQPPRVGSAQALQGVTHPQHSGAGHWTPVSWRVRPVQARRIRLVLARNPLGYPPADRAGQQAAYSLGVRNLQPGYRITRRGDIPRHGDVETHDESFASSTDLLGSRVDYRLREEPARNVLDGDPATVWRSSPQPVNYAVVNFYADVRDGAGEPAVIDRFFIDPITVGAHVNLYYSNDEPTLDFAASDEPLTYPIAERHGGGPTAYYPPAESNASAVTYNSAGPGYTDIDNAFLQHNGTRPWWLGLEMVATADSLGNVPGGTADTDHPWFSADGAVLRQHDSTVEYVGADGTILAVNLPPEHTVGSVFRVLLAHHGGGQMMLRYVLGGVEPLQSDGVVPLGPRGSTVALGRYPNDASPGVSAMSVRALVLKAADATEDDLAAFAADGPGYVTKGDFDGEGSTTNAILRLLPWLSVADTNPDGLFGGPGDRFEYMAWTPVCNDYSLRRGFLELPPTRSRYWKFEFTKLVPEPYESFVPIQREVRLFTSQTVQHFAQTGGASGPTNPRDGGGGVRTMLDLTDLHRYSAALDVLAGRTSSQAATALVATSLSQAQQIANLGWVWSFTPWHMGSIAPRFVDTQVHRYEKVIVEHRTKVGFFAGIKTLQAYRVDYHTDDDTARIVEHFLDDFHFGPVGADVAWAPGEVTSASSSATLTSHLMESFRPVRALQIATLQSDAFQMLADDGFRDDNLYAHWSRYGDADLALSLQDRTVLVNRGFQHRTYGEIETDSSYGTYANLDGKTYGEIEGGQSNGVAGGGLQSEPVTPSASGRVYGAAKVTSDIDLAAPITIQIVSQQTGLVLASAQRVLRAGETQTLTVSYSIGTSATPLTYADIEGDLYGDLDGTTYGSHDSAPIVGDLFVRVLQEGGTSDHFKVKRLSMFDDVISWEFTVDDGATWWDARDIRNNPDGVLSLPVPGTQMRWRLRMFKEGVKVNALVVRPWYAGLTGGIPSNDGLHVAGPNRSVQDQYAEIHADPMWRSWHDPIPRWWYEDKILAAASFAVDQPPTQQRGPLVLDDVIVLPSTP